MSTCCLELLKTLVEAHLYLQFTCIHVTWVILKGSVPLIWYMYQVVMECYG
jgi:hypothetical protein